MKTCHYDVLGCDQDADDAEIKKCYHRAALRWHPDKNPGSAEAVEKFKVRYLSRTTQIRD
eukprot:SAG31_NODE_39570_length_287_cov_0.824468_1_plen_59_part_10